MTKEANQLRAIYRGLRWLLRNTRRAFILLRWLSTGQFTRAGLALLPYYQRYLPLRMKKMIPQRLRAALRKRLEAAPSSTSHEPMSYGAKIDYARWIARNDTLSEHDRLLIQYHLASFKNKPKFSILMPLLPTREKYLRQAIDSITSQLYADWELYIVSHASTEGNIRRIIEGCAQKDSRISLHYLSKNGSISHLTNKALEWATGDWIVFMNPEDVLSEHALYLIAETINREPDAGIVYSDHDQIDAKGQRVNPYFKPDWDYDLFLGQNYINPLCAYRADLAHRAGGIREGLTGAQDWDFALRVLESVPNTKVHHIPFIVYHQRRTENTFSNVSQASEVNAAQQAVNEHLERTGRAAVALPQGHSNCLRIKWSLPTKRPLVSIIIPTKDQCQLLQTCIDGLINRTSYTPLEIVIVDNGSSEPEALAFLAEIRSRENIKVVEDSGPFNFSRLVNLGVANSSGEICVLLNNDVDVINPDWLDEMVSHALRPEVGAVGAKLYYPNGTLQHGGIILGIAGEAGGYVHKFLPRKSPGYFHRLNLTHSLSAVTAACLAVRREVYDRVGGFNEQDLAVCANDVDFCLRLRQAGYRIIWTPHAELYRHESFSRGSPHATPEKAAKNKSERAYMRKRWGSLLDNDPYYNPNLSLSSPSFEIAAMTRARMPWYELQFAPDQDLTREAAVALQAAAERRLNLSIAARLSQIDWYKNQICEYVSACTPSKPAKDRKRIVIYTAISGGYDSIKLPEKIDPRFDYIIFTDSPAPDTGVWQIRPMTYFDADPFRMARYVKIHPHLLLKDYDIAVWIDSNIMILGDIYPLVEQFQSSGRPVAAVPHPLRKSVYEELDACIHYNKDDSRTMREQVARYRSTGFDHDDLIESNLMIFNLGDERLKPFLDTWWAEIECYSRRDQLSLNYALAQNCLEWHRLMERPNSVRNHPAFAFVRHDANLGLARKLIDALEVPFIDPYEGPSYAEVREKRIAAQKHRRIDIVVCVHNALENVKLCLDSICRTRKSDCQRLIIIDDGSDQPTAQYLKEFANNASWVQLHRNKQPKGYTGAANQGLAASTGELVILLNSDTIVTDGWAEKMADAVFSTPGAGIVGPMSNAASHQSIPEHRGTGNQTAINDLPPGVTAEDMNHYCEQWTTAGVLPRVPLVHGFCLGITREVIDKVGFLDEKNFPRGYGEENDYCFRAADAGFSLVIATHTYVFHSKSKSYAERERVTLMKAGSQAFERLHGRSRIQRAVRSMQENPILVALRQHAWSLYHGHKVPNTPIVSALEGHTHSEKIAVVVARVSTQMCHAPSGSAYIRVVRPLQHPSISRILRLLLAKPDCKELENHGSTMNALLIQRDAIKSPERAKELVEFCQTRGIRLIYEIDDDLFHLPKGHPNAQSYTLAVKEAMENIARNAHTVIVSTEPLKERMMSFNSHVIVVPNALDERLWLAANDAQRPIAGGNTVRILYMGTGTHDGDLEIVLPAIEKVRQKYGDRVIFDCIGGFAKEPLPGVRVVTRPDWALTYPEFAKWMSHSCHYDIAIAPLADNEFNRCKSYIKYLDYGICGFASILSNVAPYRAAVKHGETGLLVENDPESWYEALCTLIEDSQLRRELGQNARDDVLAHHTLAAQAEERQRLWWEILS